MLSPPLTPHMKNFRIQPTNQLRIQPVHEQSSLDNKVYSLILNASLRFAGISRLGGGCTHCRAQHSTGSESQNHNDTHGEELGCQCDPHSENTKHGDDKIVIKANNLRKNFSNSDQNGSGDSDIRGQAKVDANRRANSEASNAALHFTRRGSNGNISSRCSNGCRCISNRQKQNSKNSDIRRASKDCSQRSWKEVCNTGRLVQFLFSNQPLERRKVHFLNSGNHQTRRLENPAREAR
mmetsp:Transcript_20517/g.56665  ORF Transcript_20517/g.56665 Transcript_20517/m.56665 type:complete len:237 (+) Transcript_20517:96-806(+)